MRPLAIDLFCGLGGWTEGLLAEGYRVVGFDIERHQYGARRYPAQLVIQDVLTLHGSQFKGATLIVASPPCQEYSYMAMPWKLAKAKAAALRADTTGRMLADLNRLFDACFRIQAEASLAAGRHVPMVVENVRGAQPWVGRARWNFGSFYLWGDVPALMPAPLTRQVAVHPTIHRGHGSTLANIVIGDGIKGAHRTSGSHWTNPDERGVKPRGSGAARWDKALDERRKEATAIKNGKDWFGAGEDCSLQRRHGSKSPARKAASAMIAKIPMALARHVAAVFHPSMATPMGESPSPAPPLPDDWAETDLTRCFAEYTRHCREAHLRGEPVAALFRPQGGEAGR